MSASESHDGHGAKVREDPRSNDINKVREDNPGKNWKKDEKG